MTIEYNSIARACALRANQLQGGTAATRKTDYALSSIETALDGVEVPWGALKQTILDVEAELASMVGNSSNEQFRASLAAASSNLATGATVPTTDSSGFKFVGAFDGLFDATGGLPLTEQPESIVSRYNTNTGSFWKIQPGYFARVGTKLFHTTTNAVYRGCSWDRATQSTAFDTAAATPATQAFLTANVSTVNDEMTSVTTTNYYTGLRVRLTAGTTLPVFSPVITTLTDLYAIIPVSGTVAFGTTLANALAGTRANITGAGSGDGTIVPQVGSTTGGGTSPLPQELTVLWICEVLAALPQENWFIPEASYYRTFAAEKRSQIIEGKIRVMSMPTMPNTTSRIEANLN